MGSVSTIPCPVLALLKGSGAWMAVGHQVDAADTFPTLNPASAEIIAHVRRCSIGNYEQSVANAEAGFEAWRCVPAPRRGELVRVMGNKLRAHKDALGTLLALETGKIKQEGGGEVQEMIDIADFAVGQARMLYGKTMHSERPHHRMYEQWHPLGVVGVVTAFNFPMAVWAWNAFIAAIAGNNVVWKPSPKAPLCAIALHNLCVEAMRELELQDKNPIAHSLGYAVPRAGCSSGDSIHPLGAGRAM
jgi:aldehyde dehydrogenase (NAD+)